MSPAPEFGCTSGRQCAGKALVLTCDGCRRKFHGHLLTVVGDGAGLLCRTCQRDEMTLADEFQEALDRVDAGEPSLVPRSVLEAIRDDLRQGEALARKVWE